MLKINELEQLDRWLESLKKYCWIVSVGILLLEILIFFGFNIMSSSKWENKIDRYILEYILFPTIRNIIFIGLGSLGINMYLHKKKKIAAYIGLITVSLIIMNFIYTHIEVLALIGLIFLPVILSVVVGDKEFTDHIALFDGLMLLLIETKVVDVLDLSTGVLVANIVGAAMSLVIVYGIARGILEYYGDVLKCWNIASEAIKIEPMTGVCCKKAICEELEEIVDEAKSSSLSIAILDVDNIKQINETYGRNEGDRIIIELANILKKNKGKDMKIGRYGGNEFIIIFANHGIMQVITICETIREEFYTLRVEDQPVSISLGIATLTDKTRDSIELVIKGKEALKKAKENGKNKTVVS